MLAESAAKIKRITLEAEEPVLLPGGAYRLGEKIGRGVCGSVYALIEEKRGDTLQWVCKEVLRSDDDSSQKEIVEREVECLSCIDASGPFDRLQEKPVKVVVKNTASGEWISTRLYIKRMDGAFLQMPPEFKLEGCRELLLAVHQLYQARIFNLDLNSDNLLFKILEGRIRVVIHDFGLAMQFPVETPSHGECVKIFNLCNKDYRQISPPDLIELNKLSKALKSEERYQQFKTLHFQIQMFLTAQLIYRALTGELPFGDSISSQEYAIWPKDWRENSSLIDIREHLKSEYDHEGFRGRMQAQFSNMGQAGAALLSRMISPMEAHRPTIAEFESFIKKL